MESKHTIALMAGAILLVAALTIFTATRPGPSPHDSQDKEPVFDVPGDERPPSWRQEQDAAQEPDVHDDGEAWPETGEQLENELYRGPGNGEELEEEGEFENGEELEEEGEFENGEQPDEEAEFENGEQPDEEEPDEIAEPENGEPENGEEPEEEEPLIRYD